MFVLPFMLNKDVYNTSTILTSVISLHLIPLNE